MDNTSVTLHKKFNRRDDHIPPVRVKHFTREKLVMLFAELGFKRGAEIGVAEGNYSNLLCTLVPGLQIYCVDPYHEYYRGGSILRTNEECEARYQVATKKLAAFDATFLRMTSVEAAKQIPDGSLDFVYIDGDHAFDFVMLDLIAWYPKVRSGGIVSGHDYYRFRGAGVVDAVNAFTHAHGVYEFFLDDQRETSFFWAKP
jgi:predicted O-methyltransferase YrrM